MSEGKVDHLERARLTVHGERRTDNYGHGAVSNATGLALADALIALVEEVRGLNRRVDEIGPILQDISRRPR